jgi:NAD(P)-dependent dehydrogenase (short-subunit alcohol dehydrogenase family)
MDGEAENQSRERETHVGTSADVLVDVGDMTDPAVADRVIAGAVGWFSRVDTLVNNAGVIIAKPFAEDTACDFAHELALNLAGFFHISLRAVRQMLTHGGGAS